MRARPEFIAMSDDGSLLDASEDPMRHSPGWPRLVRAPLTRCCPRRARRPSPASRASTPSDGLRQPKPPGPKCQGELLP
eukprot:390519-Alexandrium_andersonii.AAC.1